MIIHTGGETFDFEKWIYALLSKSDKFIESGSKITVEWQCYVIGKYCELEKANRKNNENINELLMRIGQNIGYTEPTLRRFVSYYKAIDYLSGILPDITMDILSGKIKLSIECVKLLIKRPYIEICKTIERIKLGEERMNEIFPERKCSAIHRYNEKAREFANSYPPLLVDDYNRIEKNMSKEFKWYVIGLTCLLAREKNFQTEELNNLFTKEQIAENSGYSTNSMKHFVSYAKSIIQLQEKFCVLATTMLEGKTSLSTETTAVLTKLSSTDISLILEYAENEDISISRAVHEYKKRPNEFYKSTKKHSKSIKEIPCYDPDAQFMGLIYTIPSWVKAINRIYASENLCEVSKMAKNKLCNELRNLKSTADTLLGIIMEV